MISAAVAVIECAANLSALFSSVNALTPETRARALDLLEEIYLATREVAEGYIAALLDAELAARSGKSVSELVVMIEKAQATLTLGRSDLRAQLSASRDAKIPPGVRSFLIVVEMFFYADEEASRNRDRISRSYFTTYLDRLNYMKLWETGCLPEDSAQYFPEDAAEVAKALRVSMTEKWESLAQRYHNLRLVIRSRKFG